MKRENGNIALLLLPVAAAFFMLLVLGGMLRTSSEPAATPWPTVPGRRFDERTEVLLEMLEHTPTGHLLVRFLRESSIQVEWTWIEIEGDSDRGLIRMSTNPAYLADPVLPYLAEQEKTLAAMVLAHEIAHHLCGDHEGMPIVSPERDRAEQRANLVELKVWRELRSLEGEATEYVKWWRILREEEGMRLPAVPWNVAGNLENECFPAGVELARQVFDFPEPLLP